jgi:tetratricopeptide (TPR) repeat protein
MLVLPIFLALTLAQCNDSFQPAVQALRENNAARASAILQSIPAECQQSSSFFELTGVASAMSGNFSAAETALRRAISLDPKSARLREQLGAIYLRDKKAAEAAGELKEAVTLDPSNPVIKKYLIGAYVETGKWHQAAALFDQLSSVGSDAKDPIMVLWLARTLIETKQFGRLDSDISPEQTGMAPALLFSLGTLFAEHGMYERAVRYFRQIPTEEVDDAVYFNLGLAYSHLHSFEEARRDFFRAIDKHPEHVEAYFRIGLDYSAAGQGRMAAPWLFRAKELAPNRPDISYALAEQLLQLKYFESARKIVTEALAISSADPILLVASADIEQQEGQSAAAVDNYKKALNEQPKLVAALVGLAQVFVSQGNVEQGRQYLQEALSIEPNNPSANGELGLLEAQRDDWASALPRLSKAWGADRSNTTVGLRLAQALRHTGRSSEALQILNSQQSSMEESSAFHLELAQVYTQLHRPADARKQRDVVAKMELQSQDSLRFDSPTTYVQ